MTRKPIDMRMRWKKANIPAQHQGLRLADYRPYDEHTEQALAAALDYVDRFPDFLADGPIPAERGRGLLLLGNPGTGKTLLTCLVLQEVHLRHDVNVRFVAAASYINALTRSIQLRKDAERGNPEAAEKYAAIEAEREVVRYRTLLAFDDAGKEHHTASGYAADIVDSLFRERYHDALPMLVTSNLPMRSWGEVYSPSMRSFLDEAYTRVYFKGEDQRGARHAGR